jgi:hypothetical protein
MASAKIHTVLTKIFGGFAIVPFVLHRHIVPDTGSAGKRAGSSEAFCRGFGRALVTNGERSARSGVTLPERGVTEWRAAADEDGHLLLRRGAMMRQRATRSNR